MDYAKIAELLTEKTQLDFKVWGMGTPHVVVSALPEVKLQGTIQSWLNRIAEIDAELLELGFTSK